MTHRVVGGKFSRRFVYWNLLAIRLGVSRPVRCWSVLALIESDGQMQDTGLTRVRSIKGHTPLALAA